MGNNEGTKSEHRMTNGMPNFLRDHAVSLSTGYVLLVLFCNMFGFWRAFGINVFGYANLLELFSNASLYAGQSFVVLFGLIAVVALAIWLIVIGSNFIGRRLGRQEFSVHEWLGRVKFGSQDFAHLIVAFASVGCAGLLIFPSPFESWTFLIFGFLSVGIALASRVTEGLGAGWSRTLRIVLVLALSLLPAISYARASLAAQAIKQGCGTVRWRENDTPLHAGMPVYLGHVGSFLFLYDDTHGVELVINSDQAKSFRIVNADRNGKVVSAPQQWFGFLRAMHFLVGPVCPSGLEGTFSDSPALSDANASQPARTIRILRIP
jgi:hypothetical protein